MLRRFLYLQEKALDGYLSAVEGEIADGVVRHQRTRGAASGHVAVGAHGFGGGAGLGRDRMEEATSSLRETPEQRFDRLIRLLDESPETYLYEGQNRTSAH